MTEVEIIRSNREKAGIRSELELSKVTGLSYQTLVRTRMKDPGSFKVYELRQIIKYTDWTPEDLWEFITGKEVKK